jgi:hypothetical protein
MMYVAKNGPDAVTLLMNALNNSGQNGIATLTPKGDETEVVLELTGIGDAAQPVHIHTGSCQQLGGVQYPLTNLSGGKSTTTVKAPFASLRNGNFAINAHKSAQEVSVYTACGNIPQAVVIDLQALNNSGQSGKATLTAVAAERTEVVVSVTPGAAGVAQPMHIHDGQCGTELKGVKYPLTNVMSGESITTVNAGLASLLTGAFAINAHKSGAEVGTYVACGNIPEQIKVTMGESNTSGQTGAAWVTGYGDKTAVYVSVKAGARDVAQPMHIHNGSCVSLGSVAKPLTSVLNGQSYSVVDMTLKDIKAGAFAINAHKSQQEISVYVSCGDIKSGAPSASASGDSGYNY